MRIERIRAMKIIASVVMMIAALICAGSISFAADGHQPCGEVKAADGDTTAQREGASVALSVGSPIYEFDIIKTGANSSGTLLFSDGTEMEMRESSEISIYEVVSTEARSRFNVGIAEGAARVVTGAVVRRNQKGFKVTTPGGTIGIRGTTFDVGYDVSKATTSLWVISTQNEVSYTDKLTGVTVTGGEGFMLTCNDGGNATINGIECDLSNVDSIESVGKALDGEASFTGKTGEAIGAGPQGESSSQSSADSSSQGQGGDGTSGGQSQGGPGEGSGGGGNDCGSSNSAW